MTAALSDEQLLDHLRARGMVGPISPGFLASYRRDREFGDNVAALDAIPDGEGRFKRALIRVGIVEAPSVGDADLIAASDAMLGAVRDIAATGPDATEEQDRAAWERFDAAEEVIVTTPATTVAGALAKLRRAITYEVTDGWVEQAIAAGDVTTLAARAEELSGPARLLVETLCALELVAAAA